MTTSLSNCSNYWTYYIANRQETPGSQNTPLFTVMLPKPDGIQMVSNGQQGNVTIYGVNGNKVDEVNASNLQQRLKSLPKGLYIVRFGQKTATIRN